MAPKSYYPRDNRTIVGKKAIEEAIGTELIPVQNIASASDEYLKKVGKSLQKMFAPKLEHETEAAVRKCQWLIEEKMGDDFEAIKEPLTQLFLEIGKLGYLVQRNEGTETREQNKQLHSEMWHFRDEIVKIALEHRDKCEVEWDLYVRILDDYMKWMNGDYELIYILYNQVKKEWEKRHPGYEEPKVADWNGPSASDFADIGPKDTFGYQPITISDMDLSPDEDGLVDFDYEVEGMFEHLQDEITELEKQNTAYKVLLARAERVLSGEIESTAEQVSVLRQDIRDITNQKYVNSTWRMSDKENIRLLTEVAKPEGHSFPVHYKNNHHFMRNLVLRYGIDVTNRDRVTFNCTRLAWANNYWGTIKGFEDKGEVIISLWVNQQNKGEGQVPDFESDDAWDYFFETRTTLVAKQHGDEFLALERKYAPLSADFKRYSVKDLMDAHKLIMAELKK